MFPVRFPGGEEGMTTHEVTHPSKRRCFTEGCTNEPGGKWFCRACKGRIHEASVRETARQAERKADDCRKMLESLRRCSGGETATTLRQLAGLSGLRAADALRSLVGEGRAELCEVTKYRRKEQGYRPTGK
jgi:hypothetical protein